MNDFDQRCSHERNLRRIMVRSRAVFLRKLASLTAATGRLCAVVGWIGGASVLGLQVYDWLKYGKWDHVPLWEGLISIGIRPGSASHWAGVQKIIDWVVDMPLSVALMLVVGCVLPLLLEWIAAYWGEGAGG